MVLTALTQFSCKVGHLYYYYYYLIIILLPVSLRMRPTEVFRCIARYFEEFWGGVTSSRCQSETRASVRGRHGLHLCWRAHTCSSSSSSSSTSSCPLPRNRLHRCQHLCALTLVYTFAVRVSPPLRWRLNVAEGPVLYVLPRPLTRVSPRSPPSCYLFAPPP